MSMKPPGTLIPRRPGWLDVRLAQRPNESTAWVLSRDVTLTSTRYAIVIDLATTHLHLYRSAREIYSAPVGVGLPQYPTPPGRFFAAFFAAPPSPGYGAFVMVTSAHSNVITDWDMSGDAMVAIHGPLGSGTPICCTGARVSPAASGCTRTTCCTCATSRPAARYTSLLPERPGPAVPAW